MTTLARPFSVARRSAATAWPRRRIVVAAAIFWLTASGLAWNLPLNNDVAWQYWVARQLLGGARFYADIAESNPPLWFWQAMPVTRAADTLHVAPAHIAVLWIMAQIAAAAAMIAALSPGHETRRGIGAAAILTCLTLFDFGERDPMMAVGALPYALLAAMRAERRVVPAALAIGVAALAAAGFALKPHFLLVPVAIEVWLALRARGAWRPLRPETVTVAGLLTLYAATVAILTPEYFTRELPEVLSAYGEFKPPFASLWTHQLYLPCWIAGAVAILSARRNSAVKGAAVATLTFALIYAAQGKGFPYHAVPVTLGVVWTCWLLLEGETRPAVRVAAILAIGLAFVTAALVGPFRAGRIDPLTARVEALPAGATFALISAHSWNAFPLVEDRRLLWPMRNFLLWTMPAIARDPASPLARRTREEIVADLWCHPPDAILFDDPARSPAMPRNGFDYRAFVLGDREARALLGHYRLDGRVGGATLWKRGGSVAPRGTGCRTIAVRPDYR